MNPDASKNVWVGSRAVPFSTTVGEAKVPADADKAMKQRTLHVIN